MLEHECRSLPAACSAEMSVESEINDTVRRLDGLNALLCAFRESHHSDMLNSAQVTIVCTLVDDARAGARRAVALFDAEHARLSVPPV